MRIGIRVAGVMILLFILTSRLSAIADLQTNSPIQADPKQLIKPGVCSIGKTIECKNDGKSVGMFDVSVVPQVTIKVGSSVALVNKKNPEKRVFLGYNSGNRQSQIFKGDASVACYMCTGSGVQSPNDRGGQLCAPGKKLDTNYCIECGDFKYPIACSDVLTLQRAQAKGAENRAQNTNSIIRVLGLTESVPTPTAKK